MKFCASYYHWDLEKEEKFTEDGSLCDGCLKRISLQGDEILKRLGLYKTNGIKMKVL